MGRLRESLKWQKYRLIDRMFGRGHVTEKAQWDREYLDGTWEKLSSFEEASRYAAIAAYISQLGKGARILDVGCGEGILIDYLHGDGYSYYLGVDISTAAIKKAQERQNHRTAFCSTDILEIDLRDEKFDVIILNEVLYYLKDPVATTLGLACHLDDEGIFVVSMLQPSGKFIWPRLHKKLRLMDQNVVRNKHGVTWRIEMLRKF